MDYNDLIMKWAYRIGSSFGFWSSDTNWIEIEDNDNFKLLVKALTSFYKETPYD